MPNPAPPPGTTAVMILRNSTNGNYEIYDIGNNSILAAYFLGQVGLDWQPAGGLADSDSQPGGVRLNGSGKTSLGRFNGSDTSDMMLRNASTSAFQVYDISNNNITSSTGLGSLLATSQVVGFGDFNGDAMTDMMVRDPTSGTFTAYDISNNIVVANATLGTVGIDWLVAGFGDFNGDGTSDMMLRNATSGTFELYNINNNAITSASSPGTVGIDWLVAGFGNFSSNPGETDMLLRNALTGQFEVYDIRNNVHQRRIPGLRHRQQSNHGDRLVGCGRPGLASCRYCRQFDPRSDGRRGQFEFSARASDGWLRRWRRSRWLEHRRSLLRCRRIATAVADDAAARVKTHPTTARSRDEAAAAVRCGVRRGLSPQHHLAIDAEERCADRGWGLSRPPPT